jgi:hypothetical protein
MGSELPDPELPAMEKSTVGAITSGSGVGSSESEEQENKIKKRANKQEVDTGCFIISDMDIIQLVGFKISSKL